MNWQSIDTLPWEDPLVLAERFAGNDMALLYSARREQCTGRYSYLLIHPAEACAGSTWLELPALPASGDGLPLWVGYLGYALGEEVFRPQVSSIPCPDILLVRYQHLFVFDHEEQRVTAYASPDASTALTRHAAPPSSNAPLKVVELVSQFTREAYDSRVREAIEHINAGAFYQANLTRKFWGQCAETIDGFALFKRLVAASPAPYAMYLHHQGKSILSSSPESFLRMEADGRMTTRPIKGSARRSSDPAEDARIAQALQRSEKNHAENLMITDLMRNDLARVSLPESVRVTEQSARYSYQTIHHLISTIEAMKRPEISAFDAVRACFPPGSMTGAPKIAAMRWLHAAEGMERGVYSGAIGWFGAGDTCDLSVVIRTIIVEKNRFEFQVGGGIVADSTPEDEWRETLAKARGICAALGVSEADLERL